MDKKTIIGLKIFFDYPKVEPIDFINALRNHDIYFNSPFLKFENFPATYEKLNLIFEVEINTSHLHVKIFAYKKRKVYYKTFLESLANFKSMLSQMKYISKLKFKEIEYEIS